MSNVLTVLESSVVAGDWVLVSDVDTAVLLTLEELEGELRVFRCQVLYDPSGQANDYAKLNPQTGPSLRLALATLLVETFSEDFMSPNVDERADCLYQGALNNPKIGMLSDDEVFRTSKSIADFDRYTLTKDYLRAAQFFRWKAKAYKEARRLSVGDMITAQTDTFSQQASFIPNPYPLIPLSPDTQKYITDTARPRPRIGISQSQSFALRIIRIMKGSAKPELLENGSPAPFKEDEFESGNIATVCECRVVSVDGAPISQDYPTLCVKILDDRLLRLRGLQEPEPGCPPQRPRPALVLALTSEELVRWEDAAYRRLKHAQGSVVPYYFGCHTVSRPAHFRTTY